MVHEGRTGSAGAVATRQRVTFGLRRPTPDAVQFLRLEGEPPTGVEDGADRADGLGFLFLAAALPFRFFLRAVEQVLVADARCIVTP